MTDTGDRRGVWRDAAGVLVLAAVLRAAYAVAVPRMLDSADSILYLEAARSLARGDAFGVDPKIPVLYPALTSFAHLFLDDIEIAGQAVSFFFSALLVLPVYLLARHLHGPRAARIAGVLVAAWPWLLDYSNRVATEPVAVFWWMTAALCLVKGLEKDGSIRWMISAALSFSALHFARAEGTFVLLAAFSAGFIAGWGTGERKSIVRKFAVFGLVASALLLAHAAYLHALVGQWTVNYRAGFIGEQPEGSSVLVEFGKTIVAMTGDVPAVMLGPLLWAAFGIGLAVPRAAAASRPRAELLVLYMTAVQWLVVIPVLSPAPRYLMAAFVAWSIWSARGLEQVGAAMAVRWPRARGVPLAAVLGWMALNLAAAVAVEHRTAGGLPAQPWEYKIAGEWMRANVEPGPIISRKPQVGFYAEMPTVGLAADATIDGIVQQAQELHARYLVVDERYSARLVLALRPLLDPANAPSELRVVKSDLSPYSSGRIVIYEVK